MEREIHELSDEVVDDYKKHIQASNLSGFTQNGLLDLLQIALVCDLKYKTVMKSPFLNTDALQGLRIKGLSQGLLTFI
jgi:hypothetical protein